MGCGAFEKLLTMEFQKKLVAIVVTAGTFGAVDG
jgi:hypothetical protein